MELPALPENNIPTDNRFTFLTRNVLKDKGSTKIVKIIVCRIPISKSLDNLLEILSLKTWKEAKRISNYDNMFHLFALFVLNDTTTLLVEKNANIIVRIFSESQYDLKDPKIEKMDLDIYKRNLTLNQMFKKHRDTLPGFFTYSAFEFNCQRFLSDLLRINRVITPDLSKFITQDIEQVCKNLPFFLDKMTRVITDIGSYIGRKLDDSGLTGLSEKSEVVKKTVGSTDLRLREGGLVKNKI